MACLTHPLTQRSGVQGTPVRVISVSSDLHRRGTVRLDDLHSVRSKSWGFFLYANSKLANALHVCELARRYMRSLCMLSMQVQDASWHSVMTEALGADRVRLL